MPRRTGQGRSSAPKRQRIGKAKTFNYPNRGPYQGSYTAKKMYRMRGQARFGRSANYADLAFATYDCSTTGSIALLNTVATGAAQTQRVGKKILMKSLQIRGLVTNKATTISSQVAWMIVYDRRPAAALPLITDILNSISPNSFLNDANSARFKILHRWSETLLGDVAVAADTNDETAYNVDEYLKIPKKNRKVSYGAAGTGAIGDIDQGALYLVTVGGNAAGTAASSFLAGFRLRFWDIAG